MAESKLFIIDIETKEEDEDDEDEDKASALEFSNIVAH